VGFFICGLGVATINLPTKFEVSTHNKDTKGDTKCQKWGSLGSLKVTENSSI